jgi:hypothetical protein
LSAAICFSLALELVVEHFGAREHFQRRFASIRFLLLVVYRRVPKRHDGVADIFVDGALALDDGVGKRGEESVHQAR